MTPELQHRCRHALPPFDGSTVATCDDPTVDDLLQMLRLIVPPLTDNHTTLFRFFDWHAHDGFITEPDVVESSSLLAVLQSQESLADSLSRDDYVLTAVYPVSCDWLLRYGISGLDDPGSNDWWPELDLTVSPNGPGSRTMKLLQENWPGYTDCNDAISWFRNQYRG